MPRIGKRIIKSAVGVWLCYVVQRLRGGSGIVFYSQLAVLWCIQPYIKDSLKNGIQRMTGTLIGAACGLLVLLISLFLFPQIFLQEHYYELLVSVFVVFVLYVTVVTKHKNASYFSVVVFLSIVVIHIGDLNPYLFVWNRVLDTMIGIVLGVAINIFRIPRRKQKDILFVSGVDDTLIDQSEKLSAFSKIELNRMLDDGANFTVSTIRTPASVMDALDGIHWRLPLIVMDGAALFDMKERRFIKTQPLTKELTEKLKDFFTKWEINCFVNVDIDGTLVICFHELQSETQQAIYDTLRESPYRNFVKTDLSTMGDVLYFMTVGEKEKTDILYADLKEMPYFNELKVLYYPSTDYPGQMYLKIYEKNATKENMIAYLKTYTGIENTLTFGSIEGKYDVLIHAGEEDVVAHTLEKVYEPYFFRHIEKTGMKKISNF